MAIGSAPASAVCRGRRQRAGANSGANRLQPPKPGPFAAERRLYSRHGCFKEGAGSGRCRLAAVLDPGAGTMGGAGLARSQGWRI